MATGSSGCGSYFDNFRRQCISELCNAVNVKPTLRRASEFGRERGREYCVFICSTTVSLVDSGVYYV